MNKLSRQAAVPALRLPLTLALLALLLPAGAAFADWLVTTRRREDRNPGQLEDRRRRRRLHGRRREEPELAAGRGRHPVERH